MFESEQRFSKESIEGIKMKHFTYVDKTNHPDDKIVFECDAVDILEADVKYKEETGIDVTKQPLIGCRVGE